MKNDKFMLGSPVLMGNNTVPGVAMPEELKRLLPEIYRKVSEFGCDFYPTVVEMLTYDEISEIAAYGGFPVRYPHWKWGMEYEELQRGYMHGMHKIYEMVVNCCVSDTQVVAKDGSKKITEVKVGEYLLSRGGWRKVVLVKKQPKSETLRLKLKEFFPKTICTPNHKWKVLREGRPVWAEVKNITKNDVVLAGGIYEDFLNKPAEIKWTKDNVINETAKNIRHRLKNINPPQKMTLELAELLGLVAGDGSVGVQRASSTISVCVHKSLEDYKVHVSKLINNVFGLRSSVYVKPKSVDTVVLCNKFAVDYFNYLGFKKGSTYKTKRVPWSIWKSSNEYRAAYLRGLFDTDGYCGSVLSLSCYSDDLAQDVQLLLLEMGIRSKCKRIKNKHNNIVVLTIKGKQHIRLFQKLIGFSLEYKSKKLENLSSIQSAIGKGQKMPGFNEVIFERIDSIKKIPDWMYRFRRNKKDLSSNAYWNFLRRAIDSGYEEYFGDLINIVETPIYEVEEIVKDEFQETYDVALDHNDHDFLANGLISHNTNPVYLYCLDSNTLVDNVTVVAHALGHADFFKNNIYFSQTSQNMMNQLANHGARIRKYMSRWGKERVIEFIDNVLRIETLIEFSKAWERKKFKNPIIKDHRKYNHPSRLKTKEDHDYMDDYLNPKEWIENQQKEINRAEIAEYLDIFNNPTKDIMGFIRDYAPLKPWEADIVAMLYDESMYFAPQRLTKTINEGFACVAPDTLISTKNGILTAKEIVEKKIKSSVFDGEDSRQISNWFVFNNRSIISIETNRGYKLSGSENHRIYNENFEWTRLDELEINSNIKLSRTNTWTENLFEINYNPANRIDSKSIKNILGSKYWKYNYYRMGIYDENKAGKQVVELSNLYNKDFEKFGQTQVVKRKSIKIPKYVDCKLASFLGYMIGDGHISKKRRSLGLTTGDLSQSIEYQKLLKNNFELSSKRKWDDTSKNGRWRISCSSTNLQDFLEFLGLKTGVCARIKEIPECILKSPKNVVASFLRSYFDCDGYAGKQGVILSTSSEKLGEQTQLILLNFGILCSRQKVKSEDVKKSHIWQLRVTGESAKIFLSEIGFNLERKQKKLKEYIENHKFFKKEIWSDKVVKIEKDKKGTVYDITVDETHKYSAHGFINHNSWVDYNIMSKQGFSSLGQDHESSGIIEYAAHKMGVLGGKYSMNPYKLGFSLLMDIEERWNKGQFGTEWEECQDIKEKENWDKKLNLGHDKVFEVRKFYNDLTLILEYFTPEFCEKNQFFEWKKYPNGEYKIENRDFNKIKKKLIQRYTNGGLPEILLTDCNHNGKGILFLEHKFDGRPLYDAYIRPVLQSLRFLWKNDVCLATKTTDGTELIYKCLGENLIDVVDGNQYLIKE